MDIQFKTDRLEKVCNNKKAGEREWGERRAKILGRRLDDLRAAETLDDMRRMPGDCHEYKHRKDFLFTLDLDGAWRLYFRPSNEPLPFINDTDNLDWSKVTQVEIIEVKKAHG